VTKSRKTAKEIIVEVLKKANRPLAVREIEKLTGLKYNTIRGRLQDLRRAGVVKRTKEGWVLVD